MCACTGYEPPSQYVRLVNKPSLQYSIPELLSLQVCAHPLQIEVPLDIYYRGGCSMRVMSYLSILLSGCFPTSCCLTCSFDVCVAIEILHILSKSFYMSCYILRVCTTAVNIVLTALNVLSTSVRIIAHSHSLICVPSSTLPPASELHHQSNILSFSDSCSFTDVGCSPISSNLVDQSTSQELSHLNNGNIHGIRCSLANVQSMNNKAHLIADYINENHIDIMFLTETWLKSNDFDNLTLHNACPPSFKYISVPRRVKRGGGLVTIFHERLKLKLSVSSQLPTSFSTFEHMLINIQFSSKIILCCLIYRPPNTSVSRFFAELTDLCTHLNSYNEILLLGDFNTGHLVNSSNQNNDLVDFVNIFSLRQHVEFATHYRGSILDLIFTRVSSSIVSNVAAGSSLSDHESVLFELSIASCPHLNNPTISSFISRCYGRMNIEAFKTDILSLQYDFSTLSSCSELVMAYNQCMTSILDVHAPPKRSRTTSRRTLPWFNSSLLIHRRTVRCMERRWRSSKLISDRNAYVTAKASYHSAINHAASLFLKQSIDRAADQPKRLWAILNSTLGRSSTLTLPDSDDYLSLAENFNTVFLDKPAKLRQVLSHLSTCHSDASVNEIPSSQHCLTQFQFLNQFEVGTLLRESPRKSSFIDPLPTWLLLRCQTAFIPIVWKIVNAAISSGMPPEYKVSCITPLLKKKTSDLNDLMNYRPVANLPFLSKLIERAVAKQIVLHLSSHEYLDPHQYAYRRFHSCETALLHVLNEVYQCINEKKVTLLVLIDLSAAFDTVDHSILSSRLQRVGISGNAHKWLMEYLHGRQQFVRCRNVSSSSRPISCGVPQGSVLGPLLFNIYLTGLRDIIQSHGIGHVSYADDLQLFISSTISDIPASIDKLQKCLIDVKAWFTASLLTLNDSKTEFIILGSPQLLRQLPAVSIQIDASTIQPSTYLRDLGVLLDSSLSFRNHINAVCSRSFMALRLISRIRRSITQSHCSILIHALVLSHLEYCTSLLYKVPKISLIKLKRVINSSFRFIHRLKKTVPVSALMKECGWLTIEQRIHLRLAVIIFGVIRHNVPSYLKNQIDFCSHLRDLRSTSQGLLSIVRTRSELSSRSFKVSAPSIWNPIPHDIKKLKSPAAFRTKLKKFILDFSDS
jgi:hypothetical protein